MQKKSKNPTFEKERRIPHYVPASLEADNPWSMACWLGWRPGFYLWPHFWLVGGRLWRRVSPEAGSVSPER